MKAVLTTARGFLRRSVMENSLLVLGVAVAVFMGAIVTGSIISYSQYMDDLLDDPQYAEITAQPAAFTTMRSNAATKMDEDMGNMRFIFEGSTAAKAMAESPSVSLTYTSEQDNFRTGEANQGGFGGFGGGMGGPVTVTATQGGATGASATRSGASGAQAGASGAQAGGPPDMGPGGAPPEDMMAAIQEEQAALAAQDTSGLDTPLLERIAGRTVSPEFFNAWGLKASEGSLFSTNDVENSKTVMVVGSDLAKTLFKDGTAMGKRLKIEGRIYTVIGVLEANDLLDTNGVRKVNEMAFMPPRSFTRKVGNTTVNMGRPIMSLTFFVKDRSKIGSAVKELQAFFDRSYKEGQVKVTSRQSTLNSRRSGQNALFGAISVLALLCLVVATLNIFNVSSIKTIRRRRSLGILRAIGASRQKAMLVFLVEVALLALSGSLIGLAAALPTSGIAIKALVPTGSGAISVNWGAEIIAALLSMVLPLAAGLFPAWRLLAQAPADLVRPE
jgi:hypothetical protein